MTFLTLFVIIPVVMLLCLWLAKNDSQVRIVMAAGSTVLLALSVYLVFAFLEARETMPAEKFPLSRKKHEPANVRIAGSIEYPIPRKAPADSTLPV